MSAISGEPRLIAVFEEQAPDGLDRALAAIVRRAYPEARAFCEQLAAPEEDRDLRGHVKRAIIEGALRTIPVRFLGVIERPVGNATDSQNHRELSFGDFTMTISHTQHALARLPDARFRDTLARPQAGFFPELDIVGPPRDGNLYSVLVHGSPRPSDLAPTFLHIVFPLPGGLHGLGIDLYARYPALRPQPKHRPTFGEAEPELRTDIDLPGEEGQTGSGA